VSRTFRILLVVVVTALAGGGYWKLVLAPKRVEANALATKVAVAQQQLAQTQALIATYKGARDEYKQNYATVVRLGKAVPTDDDTRSLLVQLDTSAKRSGVSFDTINVTAATPSTTGAPSTVPGAINVGAFSAQPFSFSFRGDFETLGTFFSRIDQFVSVKNDTINVRGRLMHLESISLTPGSKGWPTLVAQVKAASYIVPETETPAAGATGTTTQTATTTTTTTAPGTTSSATGTEIR
jgi:Tfp pilus assembly protein PilO